MTSAARLPSTLLDKNEKVFRYWIDGNVAVWYWSEGKPGRLVRPVNRWSWLVEDKGGEKWTIHVDDISLEEPVKWGMTPEEIVQAWREGTILTDKRGYQGKVQSINFKDSVLWINPGAMASWSNVRVVK